MLAPLPTASVLHVMLFVSTTGPVIETAPLSVVMSAAVVSCPTTIVSPPTPVVMSAAVVSVVTPPDVTVMPWSACRVALASMFVAAFRFTLRPASTGAVMSMSAAVDTSAMSRPAVTLSETLRFPTLVTRMSVPAVRLSVAENAPPTVAVIFPSVAVTGPSSSMLPPEVSVTS